MVIKQNKENVEVIMKQEADDERKKAECEKRPEDRFPD